jgi:spermidine synthase
MPSTILIVEDEIDLVSPLEWALRNGGFRTLAVSRGSDALALLAAGAEVHVLLLDLILPDMPGVDVCRQVRVGTTRDLPVIMMSARAEATDVLAGFVAGANEYLIKPFKTYELVQRVHAVLRGAPHAGAARPMAHPGIRGRYWTSVRFQSEVWRVYANVPLGTDPGETLARLMRDGDSRPFVLDNGVVRRLYFNLRYLQSEMMISEPHALSLAYTRKMMAFLLFIRDPRRILLVGLGGGSLAKYCYHYLPASHITVVEINPQVIAFGDLFAVPTPNARYSVVLADATDYVEGMTEHVDVVLLDGCDKCGIAPTLCDEKFYSRIYQCLNPNGVLVLNLVGPADNRQAHLRILARVFSSCPIVQDVAEDGNQVAFAFKDLTFRPRWPIVEREATRLARDHRVDFLALARLLYRTCEVRDKM